VEGWNTLPNSVRAKKKQESFKKKFKGVCHEIFDFRFFHESVSSRPLSIPLGPFRIFTKILGDILNFVFTSVKDTGDKLLPNDISHLSLGCASMSGLYSSLFLLNLFLKSN
jgi:hypothetical protein